MQIDAQTLPELLAARSGSRHTLSFVNGHDDVDRVSFGQMYEESLDCLGRFNAQGLSAGDELILQTSNYRLFIRAFWACLAGGIVPVPLAVGSSAEHRQKVFRIADKLSRPALFTDRQHLHRLTDFAAGEQWQSSMQRLQTRTITVEDLAETVAKEPQLCSVKPDSTAFIQFSSGSTSEPKGVVLTHRNLLHNMDAIIEGCRMSGDDCLLSWMPLTHDMGLIGFHLTPLTCDTSHVLIPTDLFIRRPSVWLTETDRAQATVLCSPNFGYQHLLKAYRPERHATLNLASVRLIFNGAEPISAALCQSFMTALSDKGLRADAMYPVYGLAEASLAVSFPPLDDRFNTLVLDRRSLNIGQKITRLNSQTDPGITQSSNPGSTFVGVGQAVKHVQIRIADALRHALPENHVGHVHIRGSNVTHGYYKAPDINAQTIDEEGWLDTGDLGFLSEGCLYITGRAKEVVFANGQNIYPHDLEEILIKSGIVERGKLAISSTIDENLAVFIQHRADPQALTDTARAVVGQLAREAGVAVGAVVPVPRIPKTTSGKVQRFLLAKALADGELSALDMAEGSMSDEVPMAESAAAGNTDGQAPMADIPAAVDSAPAASTSQRLLLICQSEVEGQPIGMDDNLFELGISSLTLAQIHAAIEDEWPSRIEITDLFDYPTIRQLAEFLDKN